MNPATATSPYDAALRARYPDLDILTAHTLRLLAVDTVQKANSGHPGLPLGVADLVTTLWTHFLKINPQDPNWPNRDRFVLSAGHGSALIYSLLHLWGQHYSLEDLGQFRQWGSITPGHPEYDLKHGVEITTGPLGQGFASAVGLALAERWLATYFNRPGYAVMDHFTYVLASDGDLMEGVSHEAASLAGHWKLGKLIVLYDDNKISIDGATSLSFTDDTAGRFRSYHWHVQEVNGHNMQEIGRALEAARSETESPSILICKTHIGWGSPRQDTSKAHGEPLGQADLCSTKEALGFPSQSDFYVPEPVRAHLQEVEIHLSQCQKAWEQMLAQYSAEYPELAQAWQNWQSGALPPDWETYLPTFTEGTALATRSASGKVLDAIFPHLPFLVGGSADLTPSNNTLAKDTASLLPPDYSGRYIHYGVREHAMGSIMNGLALHGMRPYSGTFLVFSDYMRPAIRLAALMKLPVIYIFTHDSIGLGEDGPTHQPIEHLTALRSIPNLVVIRPADAHETRTAWSVAINRTDGPTALILTRQALPWITPAINNPAARGAYVLADPSSGLPPQLALLATGSEVSLALETQKLLATQGVAARVVSMPSWELFDAQPWQYRQSVLPEGLPCLSIEAGITLAWPRYTGSLGTCIGLDHFGASAPYQVLYEKFGLTAQTIANHALALVEKTI